MSFEKYIVLGLTGIFALLIVIGFLFGVGRGLKKAAVRLSTVIIFAIIALLITPMITNGLYSSMRIIGGQTIKEWFAPYLGMVDDYAKYTDGVVEISSSLLEAIPLAIANLIVFCFVFWILKAISWVIFSIATKNMNKPNEEGVLPKKRRLLGGLVGVVQGLVLFAAFGMPLFGTINTIQATNDKVSAIMVDRDGESMNLFEIINQMVEAQGGESGKDLEEMLGQYDVMKYINSIQKSAPMQILKYTGMRWLFVDNGFNHLTTIKTDTGKVKVAEELPKTITSAATTMQPFIELFSMISTIQDISEINFEDMAIQDILETVFNMAASNPYIADFVVEMLETFVEDTDFGDVGIELNIGDSKEFLQNVGKMLSSTVELIVDLSESGIDDMDGVLDLLEGMSSNIEIIAGYMTITLPQEYEEYFTMTDGILAELEFENVSLYNSLKLLFGIA